MPDKSMNRKEALKNLAIGAAGLLAIPKTPSTAAINRVDTHRIQPSKTALIIVDMQNDFVRVNAPLEVPTSRDTIAAQQSLIKVFRQRNLPVVFTKFISHPHYYLLWEWSPQCKPPTKCCWKNHQRKYEDINATRECTDIIDELKPLPGDLVIEKSGYGAFHETTLAEKLLSLGVDSLVITGTVTQICVEETAREAFHYGFKTTIARDGVSSFADDLHQATLKNFAMKFGWVETSDSIISALQSKG
jgi:nicotinamidase-related amidase